MGGGTLQLREDFLMFYTFLINFSLLFTFTILVFWPKLHLDTNKFMNFFPKPIPESIMGLKFGIIGILSAYLTVDLDEGILMNGRIVLVLFSGLLGGPTAIFVSGISMLIGRVLLFDLTEFSIVMSVNFFFLILIITYLSTIYRIRLENIHRYLYCALFEISVIVLFFYNFSIASVYWVFIVMLFTSSVYWAVYWILVHSYATSEKAQQMMALKQVDYLTQLPNNYAIEAHMNHAINHNAQFSFLHIDIDHFLSYNNEYSYLIGDHILEEFAGLLKNYAKGKDVYTGRIGGEEFCYIIENAAPAIGLHEANQLRDFIEQHVFGQKYGLELQITISIGVSTMPDNGIKLEQIYKTASIALLASQKASFNQVYHYNQYLKDIEYK